MTPGNLKRFFVCLALVPLLLLSGCVFFRSPVIPYTGGGFNSTTFPVDIAFNKTDIGKSKGTASSYSVVFGLIAFGDCSVDAAAKDGKIRQIDQIDAKLFNILWLFVEYQTIVSGRTQEDLDKAAAAADDPNATTSGVEATASVPSGPS